MPEPDDLQRTELDSTKPMGNAPHPARIGKYEILGEIGRGGMGVVYRARHVHLGRLAAVKVLLAPEEIPGAVQRFLREGRIVAALDHPNIVRVHDWDSDGERCYLAMDLVDGEGLDRRLARGRLQPGEALALVETIARAVHHAHEQGVVHRDLKPGNILVGRDGKVWVTDFGLARRQDSEKSSGSEILTASGQILGTPAYLAPEQLVGDPAAVDRRADVHALGVILYELLTGERPYAGRTHYELYDAIRREAPRPPRRIDPSVPPEAETICLRALSKDPAGRPATALALAEDVARARAAIASRPPRSVAHGRSIPVRVVAALLVIAVSAVSAWMLSGREDSEPADKEETSTRAEESEEGWIDLSAPTDPLAGAISSTWTREGDALVCGRMAGGYSRFEFDFAPPTEYDFRVVFVCEDGRGSVDQYVSQGEGWMIWSMWCCDYRSIGFIWNQDAFDSGSHPTVGPATVAGLTAEIEQGRRYESLVEVRSARVRAIVNDRQVRERMGELRGLAPSWTHSLRDPHHLGVGAYDSRVRFERVEVREATGSLGR